MIEQLYDIFKHWSENGTTWMISDTHFDDSELKSGITNRPSSEELLTKINAKVGKRDTLIHLGDVGNIEYIRKIKGYKVLICGNHDSGYSNYQRKVVTEKFDKDKYKPEEVLAIMRAKYPGWWVSYTEGYDTQHSPFEYYLVKADNKLFDEIYSGPLMIGERLLLSHEPIQETFALNIHGHVHDRKYKNDRYHYNICCDCTNYELLNLNQFVKSGILSNIDVIHREIIDRATDRKRNKLKREYKG